MTGWGSGLSWEGNTVNLACGQREMVCKHCGHDSTENSSAGFQKRGEVYTFSNRQRNSFKVP